ncbi:hypothetical protein BGY98DRAFT_125274 [Russula aff. rugulosa BPL654]|nr:hypothetical protein BGY98DRAFT_125274 [Russula aff. rugulosa BPL654]
MQRIRLAAFVHRAVWKDDAIENSLWLQLLLPFTAVKNLYLSKEFAPGIAAALHELIEGRITEVLPSLQNIFVEKLGPSGPFQEKIGQFIAARQLSNHPIAISDWDKNSGYPWTLYETSITIFRATRCPWQLDAPFFLVMTREGPDNQKSSCYCQTTWTHNWDGSGFSMSSASMQLPLRLCSICDPSIQETLCFLFNRQSAAII